MGYAYLHLPFCSGVCDFCSYFLTTTTDAGADARVTTYVDQLIEQARIQQRDLDIAVSSIYIGGGTPSILHPDQLARLLDGLAGLGIFAPSGSARWSFTRSSSTSRSASTGHSMCWRPTRFVG